MIFKKISKKEVKNLFLLLQENYDMVAPVKSGVDKKGEAIYSFNEVENFENIILNYTFTKISPRKYFMDYSQTITTFEFDPQKSGWIEKNVSADNKPLAFFGLHACDINAFNKLDKILMKSIYPIPDYVMKRNTSFIVGIDCFPSEHCFCRSLGTNYATYGYDLFLTDLGDHYFVEILSSNAFNLVKKLASTEVTGDDMKLIESKENQKAKLFKKTVETTDLTKILDIEFQSPKWKIWGDKCLGCGTCSRVCPTCYCHGIFEVIDLKFQVAEKKQHLYSCDIVDFAEVAGGHNFRPDKSTRLKYRYYHKHRGFVEKYEESLCVGCGRCGEQCLAQINVPEVISHIRGEA
jgi:sulfhydrogenase subunit beta (sulfur reductase)